MDFNNLFIMQGMLFSLMLLGLYLRKIGMITDSNRELLTDLVVNVTLPCSIVKSFEMEFNGEILRSCLVIFLVAIGIQIGSFLLSCMLYPGVEEKHKRCSSTRPSAPMREFWATPSRRAYSDRWALCTLRCT